MNDSQIKSLIDISVTKAVEENNKFLIANIESIMKYHKEPSPVTIEMIKRLEEWIKEIRNDHKERDQEIIKKLDSIITDQKKANSDIGSLGTKQKVLEVKMKIYLGIFSFFSGIIGPLVGTFIYTKFFN